MNKQLLDFYGTLKSYMTSLVENNNLNGNSNATNNKPPPLPENQGSLIESIDKTTGKEKKCFVTIGYILGALHKQKLSANRSRNMRAYVKNINAEKSVKQANHDKGQKVSKLDCVTSDYSECVSTPLKLAVAVFLSPNLNDSLRRDLIATIANDVNNEKSVSYIEDLFQDPSECVAKIRNYIKNFGSTTLDKSTETYLICGLIELSELLKDKSYCKLALEINLNRYVEYLSKYMHQNIIHSIAPFEPLIAKYIHESIAKCSQDAERTAINNQFKTNPIETIENIIKGLPPLPNKLSRMSTKTFIFKPDQMYECHKGPVAYTRDIISTYYRSGNDLYKILTYNDCLFDVIGMTTESVDATSGQKTLKEELFNKLCWSDRIKLLPAFRAKVAISSVSGSELNEYNGAPSDVTVSWIDENGLSCSKTYLLKKSKEPKIKTEIEEA